MVPDCGGEKPCAILFEALKETQHVALARMGMYGREHEVIVRPGEHGILAHAMFYTEYSARRGWDDRHAGPRGELWAPRREAREKLVEARRREIDVVLVWRLDRWGRSVTDLLAHFRN